MTKQEVKRWKKKPIIIKAYQWFIGVESDDVQLLETPKIIGDMKFVGLIKTLEDTTESSHYVCEGDYIITGIDGEKSACKPDIFIKTYDHLPNLGRPKKVKE